MSAIVAGGSPAVGAAVSLMALMAPAPRIGQCVRVHDLGGGPGAGHPLASLPRVWWFPRLRGYRSDEVGTYVCHDLDDQPPVPDRDDLGWLELEAGKPEWSIGGGDEPQPVCALTPAGLGRMAGALPVPSSLRLLAGRRDLQRRIRSATGCYLDLGDFAAATSAWGGSLLHVLSDQQWCRHWMVYLDAAGNEAVVTSDEPIGFDLPDDWPSLPRVIPIGSGATGLEVCADSFAEFLYRFWIENEIFFALQENRPFTPAVASYVASLPRLASSP